MTRTPARPSRARARRRPRWQSTVAAAAAATLLAACGGGDEEAVGAGGDTGADTGGDTTATEELQEVTFLNILPLESLTFTPELVAASCGFFEDQGLDVSFETTKGSAQAIQTIIAGGALITRVGDMETMLAVAERDAPLVNVGQINKTTTLRFASAESDPLQSPEDIRGRLVGTPSEGGTSEILLKIVAAEAGIPPEEVQTQVVGLAPGVFDLVTSGRIGAYIVSLDTSVALEQQQPEAVIYSPSEDVESGGQVYITSEEQAQDPEKQEQLRAYLAAIDETVAFVAEDEANDFAETMECLSEYDIPTLENPEVARGSLSEYVESWMTAGEDEAVETVPEQWEAVYEEMVGSGFVPEGLDPSEWYTNEFVPGS